MDGLNTADHLNFLAAVPALKVADMLTFLAGANDLLAALSFEGREHEKYLLYRAGQMFAGEYTYPLYRRLTLYTLAKRTANRLLSHTTSHDVRSCEDFSALALRRGKAPVSPLPNLDVAVHEYGQRIVRIAERCRALGKRCVFLTQPSIWRGNLPAEAEARLWLGWVGTREAPSGYVSSADLGRAMDAYNKHLLNVCGTNAMECYDLAAAIPKTEEYFSDDAHFTEQGARAVARFLATTIQFKAGGK